MWVDEERGGGGGGGVGGGEEGLGVIGGGGGMIQGFAAGYFLWDLIVCAGNVGVFGWGLLAHAVAALVVFSLGFVSLTIYLFFSPFFLSGRSTPGIFLGCKKGWMGLG